MVKEKDVRIYKKRNALKILDDLLEKHGVLNKSQEDKYDADHHPNIQRLDITHVRRILSVENKFVKN